MVGAVRAEQGLTLALPHSELLEDLEGRSSAGGIAECFVQRVSRGARAPPTVGWTGGGSWGVRT